MKMNTKMRVVSLAASVALLGATAFVASGATGAYFSDSHNGQVIGTIGTIKVTPSASTLTFSDLLPGTPQSVTLSYTNSGNSPEDVWFNFYNATALSALNNLGHYGSVTVTSAGQGSIGAVFTSSNLDDNSTPDACGTLSPSGCWPLPSQLKLASGVAPGYSGTVTFTFEYASALTTPASSSWNPYPLPGYNSLGQTYAQCETAGGTHSDCSNNQVTINATDAGTAGLPYQLVATQVGIVPGDPGTKF